MAQFVVVDQVLVAERDADDALHDQCIHAVLDEVAVAAVLEAGGEAAGQSKHPVGRPQQQCAGIGGDAAAVERGNYRAVLDGCKFKQR